jgi:hypothetical protein
MSCLPDGKQSQAKAGSNEGVDLFTVGGCFSRMRDEDYGGKYPNPLADNCSVHDNLPNSQQMWAGQAKEGFSTMPLVVGTAHGLGCP